MSRNATRPGVSMFLGISGKVWQKRGPKTRQSRIRESQPLNNEYRLAVRGRSRVAAVLTFIVPTVPFSLHSRPRRLNFFYQFYEKNVFPRFAWALAISTCQA